MRCNRCGRKAAPALRVVKFGGGSYNRAGRWRPATVCTDCASTIVATAEAEVARGSARIPEKIDGYSVTRARAELERLARLTAGPISDTTPTTPEPLMTQTLSAIAERIATRHDGWTYVAMDTVEPLAVRVRAMVETGRPMTLIRRWLTEENPALEVHPGLQVTPPAQDAREHVHFWTRTDPEAMGFYVDCGPWANITKTWGFSASARITQTEAEVSARWHGEDPHDDRRDVARVRITGWPTSTDASITIERYNDRGLGEQTVIAFAMLPDDQEVADSQIEVLTALAQAKPSWSAAELGDLAATVRWNYRTVAEALAAEQTTSAEHG